MPNITLTSTTDNANDVRSALGMTEDITDVMPPETETPATDAPLPVDAAPSDESAETSDDVDIDAADDETADDAVAETPDAPRKSGSKKPFNVRLSQLTAQRYEAEAKRSAAEAEAARIREENARLQAALDDLRQRQTLVAEAPPVESVPTEPAVATPPVVATEEFAEPAPSEDDFESYQEFLIQRAEWAGRKAAFTELRKQAAAAEQVRQSQQANEAAQKILQQHQERVTRFAQEVPDYQETLMAAKDVVIGPVAYEHVIKSEFGPELVYYLAKNAGEVETLKSLHPVDQLVALGRLEGQLANRRATVTPEPPKAVAKTKTSPPIDRVSSSRASTSTKSPDELSMKEYIQWRERGGGR